MIKFNTKLSGALFTNKSIPIMRKEFRRAISGAVKETETKVAENTPVGVSGFLRTGIKGKVLTDLHGVVRPTGASVKYADVVELGRRPGKFPPVDAITLWVKRIINPKKLKQIAFLVARKIANKGIYGQFMFFKGEKLAKSKVIRLILDAKKRIEKRLSD